MTTVLLTLLFALSLFSFATADFNTTIASNDKAISTSGRWQFVASDLSQFGCTPPGTGQQMYLSTYLAGSYCAYRFKGTPNGPI